jgi:hypothetical protein
MFVENVSYFYENNSKIVFIKAEAGNPGPGRLEL